MPMRTSPGWLRNRLDGPSLLRASASPLTDVELISGDVSVLAHRLLLSVHSTYFASLFSSGMREAREGVVDVGASMGPETLVAIVDYIYSGKVIRCNTNFPLFYLKSASLFTTYRMNKKRPRE